MLYTSIENKKIKNIKKLYNKKYRDEFNEFLIEGEHLVKEAYEKGILKELILEEGTDFKLDVETSYVTSNVLKYISELSNPCKIMGICKKLEEQEIGNKIVILDGVQDPGNLGTIIRSCVAFNIDTIVLSHDCVDLYNSKVLRATQGMIFNINIIERDLIDFIPTLKGNNYKIYGTKVNGGKSLKSVEKSEKFVIIMGNEGSGVKTEILDMCSDYIYIDMNKTCESLNVGVATSIILYELDK
ncbi:MAG: RNA methyltransferase [Firmicutes bacterium]|nr:RNA methyltransferase [Bacillota bacterium]